MADKKYIPLQKGNTRKVMVKSAVIFESVITKHKRTELVNKTNYSSCDGGFWEDIYDTVSEKYDIDKIKHI